MGQLKVSGTDGLCVIGLSVSVLCTDESDAAL